MTMKPEHIELALESARQAEAMLCCADICSRCAEPRVYSVAVRHGFGWAHKGGGNSGHYTCDAGRIHERIHRDKAKSGKDSK